MPNYGYRNIGYFADCGDHGIEVCLDLASDTGNAQRRYEVDKTFGVCGNFLDALLRRRRNQGNDIYLMAARKSFNSPFSSYGISG